MLLNLMLQDVVVKVYMYLVSKMYEVSGGTEA